MKNLPHDTNDLELESMFGRFGSVVKCLIPPSKSVALVEFVEPLEARFNIIFWKMKLILNLILWV